MAICNKIQDDDDYSEFDNHVVFTYIDQWEKHSIGKIQLVARQARNGLKQIFMQQRQDITNLINTINEQLKDSSLNLDKLHQWTRQLNKLRKDLWDLSSNTYLTHEINILPIYLIKISHKNEDVNKQEEENDEINVPGTKSLTLAMLNNQSPKEQKQMLGERLFVLVQQIEPKLAAKITGMFLELDIRYILILIKSPAELKTKIKDALNILQVHQHRERHVNKS